MRIDTSHCSQPIIHLSQLMDLLAFYVQKIKRKTSQEKYLRNSLKQKFHPMIGSSRCFSILILVPRSKENTIREHIHLKQVNSRTTSRSRGLINRRKTSSYLHITLPRQWKVGASVAPIVTIKAPSSLLTLTNLSFQSI